MHRLRALPLAAALTLLAAACVERPVGPGPDPDIQVASARIKDEWPLITVRIEDGRLFASDGQGDYVNGVGGVYSVLQGSSIGDWVIDLTGRGTTRAIRLDLSQPLPGNPGVAPFSSATIRPRMIALGSVQGTGSFYGMNTSNKSTLDSPLATTFNYNGTDYALRMNARNTPGTNWVSVVCTAENTAAQCAKWELTPSGVHNSEAKNVAYLERVTSRGNVTIGYFYVDFQISLSR